MTWPRLVLGTLIALITPGVAAAAQILSPTAQTIVRSGAVVTVTVGPAAGEVLSAASVATSAESADGVPGSQAGTFDAQVHIPLGAAGPTIITAIATLASGRLSLAFVQVVADPGALQQLVVGGPRVFTTIGQIGSLSVAGIFADGVPRSVPLAEQGTTYSSTNPTILAVDTAGHVQARSRGTAQIVVTYRQPISGLTSTAGITIRADLPDPPDNHIPVPDTGPDQTVAPEAIVQLDASATLDADNDALTFHWHQESGRAVVMRGQDTATPFFIAPRVTATEILEFSLVVRDAKGATTLPKIVKVTVQP